MFAIFLLILETTYVEQS